MKCNDYTGLNIFESFLIETPLNIEPPLYLLIVDDNEECFLSYVEKFTVYVAGRKISNNVNLSKVLKNDRKYFNISENILTDIEEGDFKNIEINIRNLSEILDIRKIINPHQTNNFLFRGQADKNWKIESSLFRNGFDENKEKLIYSEIKHINHEQFTSEDFIKLASNMQHYGIPTRLVDWTGNILNALYFACVSSKEDMSKDGSVFMMSFSDIVDIGVEEHEEIQAFFKYKYGKNLSISEGLFPILKKIYDNNKQNYQIIKTILTNDRIRSQDGYFSICFEAKEEEVTEFLIYKVTDYIQRNNKNIPDKVLTALSKKIQVPFDENTQKEIFRDISQYTEYTKDTEIDLVKLREALERFQTILPIKHDMNSIQKYESYLKIIIPSEFKQDIIKELDRIGINSSTIYPDLEGLTKYIKEKYSY